MTAKRYIFLLHEFSIFNIFSITEMIANIFLLINFFIRGYFTYATKI